MHDRKRVAAIALVSAILMYVIGTTSELLAIKQLQPSEIELTWVSDAILAAAFGFATSCG